MNSTVPIMPKTILAPLVQKNLGNHTIGIFCAGIEGGLWRSQSLAHNLMAWLPDFALTPEESFQKEEDDAWERFRISANKIYKTGFPEKRGEIGELILHILCRRYFNTYPSVSKIYYKTSGGEVVKGFDLVHTKYDESTEEVEFWFGEAKFYKDGAAGVREAVSSVKDHLDMGFLKSEKIAIYNKVITETPGYDKIDFLLHIDTSVDEITKRMVIPILITFDSEVLAEAELNDSSYVKAISDEVSTFVDKIITEHGFDKLDLRLLFVPTATKKVLLQKFDKLIKAVAE